MNDFTKEELAYILECIETDVKYYGADHVGHGAREKLQFMIENYNDHKTSIMSKEERERKFKIYSEQILQTLMRYGVTNE